MRAIAISYSSTRRLIPLYKEGLLGIVRPNEGLRWHSGMKTRKWSCNDLTRKLPLLSKCHAKTRFHDYLLVGMALMATRR